MMTSALVMLRVASAGKRTTGVQINFDTSGSRSGGSSRLVEQMPMHMQTQVKSSVAGPGSAQPVDSTVFVPAWV